MVITGGGGWWWLVVGKVMVILRIIAHTNVDARVREAKYQHPEKIIQSWMSDLR